MFKKSHNAGPDFLCVGARKAGTTWLYKYLKKHPEVSLPMVKELNFFGAPFANDKKFNFVSRAAAIEKYNRYLKRHASRYSDYPELFPNPEHFRGPLDWYQSFFDVVRKQNPGIATKSGELSPLYANLPEKRIQKVKRLLKPDVKIIYILREPTSRFISDHFMQKGDVWDEKSLRGSIANGDKPANVIQYWSSVFGDNFKVFYFEDFIDDNKKFAQDICEFIGIAPDVVDANKIRNPNARKKTIPDSAKTFAAEMLYPDIQNLNDLLKSNRTAEYVQKANSLRSGVSV